MINLQSDESLKVAIQKVIDQVKVEDWYPKWVADLTSLFQKVEAAGLEERETLAFQKMLWDDNPVSGVGMGTVSLGQALNDPHFRNWIAESSLQPIPQDFDERSRFYTKFQQDLQAKLKVFTNRTPRLKIYRLMAALFPNDFTTISFVNKVPQLYNMLFAQNAGASCIRQHMEIARRFREVLADHETSPEALAKRITLPWLVYERTEDQEAVEQSFEEEVRPGTIKLKPMPAFQRRKGLTSIKGGLESLQKAISFVGEGVQRDELMEYFRVEFPDYAKSSLNTLLSLLRNEFFVLVQEGSTIRLTRQGASLLNGGETSELLPGLITRILGVDNVLYYLRQHKQASQQELLAMLKVVNPGWTSDFAPATLLRWLRDFELVVIDKQKSGWSYSLSEDGLYWAGLIDWEPENLSVDEEPSGQLAPVASDAVSLHLPPFEKILAGIKGSMVCTDTQLASLHVGLWGHERRHFAILAGLSGSGKTMLARSYGKALAAPYTEYPDSHVCTLAVQPGWYDAAPLMGYVNPLSPDTFVRPALLDFFLKAVQNPGMPYTLILDEMNLSHPEQYLAPILSAMESGDDLRFHNQGAMFDGVPDKVPYPKNLCIIGTVNMDETTHGLSDKVLDRAFTMEFWKIDLDDYPDWDRKNLKPEEVNAVRACLSQLQAALEPVRLHFGWRTIKDVLDYLDMYQGMQTAHPLSVLLDDAIYARVLPKLRGNESLRMESALKKTKGVLEERGLKRSAAKVFSLMEDLSEQGSMRFWR